MSMWDVSSLKNIFGSSGSAIGGGSCNAQNACPSSSAAMATQLSAQTMAAQLSAQTMTAQMAAQLQNIQNTYSTKTISSTVPPGSFVDYEDRQNPTSGSALLGSSSGSGKFLLLVDDVPAEYPNPAPGAGLEGNFGSFARWRIATSRDGQAVCSGSSFLILPLMIVDALNAKVTRDDVRSIKIAKEL
jgi:hypothetical protein